MVTGYRLGQQDTTVIRLPKYDSNLADVEHALREKEGRTPVGISVELTSSIHNKYESPPLKAALELRDAFRADPRLERLLTYFAEALEPGESWFDHLYKVREELKAIHGNDDKLCQAALGIAPKQWSDFGKDLNNHDLRHRHSGDEALAAPLSQEQINHLLRVARSWVAKELKKRTLPYTTTGLSEDLL